MVDFSDHEELEAWLRTQPREVAVTLAAHAAGRALPALEVRNNEDSLRLAVFHVAVLRATAIARGAAKHPSRARDLAAAAAAANRALVYPEASVSAAAALAASGVPADAAASAAAASAAFAARVYAAAAFAADADAPDEAAPAAARAHAYRADVHANAAINAALWPADSSTQAVLPGVGKTLPDLLAVRWRDLKAWFLAHEGSNFSVWTDWYDAWLAGREQFPQLSAQAREDLDIAICLIPDEDWAKGPVHVNAIIRGMIDKALAKAEVKDEDLPTQAAGAALFGPDAQGRMAATAPTAADRLSDLPDVVFFYAEARDLCADLHALGLQHLGEPTFKCANRMRRVFPEAPGDAVEREIWAAGNALRRKLSAHDAVALFREPHPARLETGAVEPLRAFVEAFNQLAFADPKLRARDERRPGPQEARDAKAEVAMIAPVSEQAARDDKATAPDAAEELREQTTAARDADDSVVGRNAAAHARDTHRNFHAGLLVSAYRVVREVRKMAKGEGGFVSKEMFGGAYKAIGAGALTAGGAVLTGHVNWDAVQIVVQNLPTFRHYAPLAFEAAPGVGPLLDYLEATVEIEDRTRGR